VRFTEWSLRADSGGDGRHRGGLGAVYEIELLEQDAEVFVFGERGTSPPKGIAGGGAGAVNVFRYENAGEWHVPPMVSKMRGIRLERGERVRLETPGGGGWGEAAERPAAQRAADRAMGYVTTGNDKNDKDEASE
jgi:N-methylhydantoinase B